LATRIITRALILSGIIMLFIVCVATASSDYCTPLPNDLDITYTHTGNWFNFTISSPSCYVCSDNGGGYGDVDCVVCGDLAPIAGFSSNVTCGIAPFNVQFTDTTTGGGITDYYWAFGDGNTSTVKNPVFGYNATGSYSINHSATSSYGTSWKNVSSYIQSRYPGDTCQGESAKVYEEPPIIPLNPMVAVIAIIGAALFISVGKRRRLL
jgi:PKD repeat protein